MSSTVMSPSRVGRCAAVDPERVSDLSVRQGSVAARIAGLTGVQYLMWSTDSEADLERITRGYSPTTRLPTVTPRTT